MESSVLIDSTGQALTITLNRPEKLNCINWEMMKGLEEAVAAAEEKDDLQFVVIRGAGDRAFSTGGDLNEFRSLSVRETARWIRSGQRIFNRIESLATCTIAVLDGYTYGGGLELAIACDFRVATPQAKLASPEIQHGWPPGWGALSRLGRLIGTSQAKELILLGEPISGPEALRIGLVNWVVEPGELDGFIIDLGKKLAHLDPNLIAFVKSTLSAAADQTASSAMELDVLATAYARGNEPSDE